MVFKIRKLKGNDVGSGFATLLVIIPFIFCAILTVVSMPIDRNAQSNMGVYYLEYPSDYDNMSVSERQLWFCELHDGDSFDDYEEYVKWGQFNWDVPFLGTMYVKFPDGFTISRDLWWDYSNGLHPEFELDYLNIAKSILTLDPPALGDLEVYGAIFRVLLGCCVAVGLAEMLWPF